jgi:hypothetical protein
MATDGAVVGARRFAVTVSIGSGFLLSAFLVW